ncbi:hypothetical protein [Endothiovibrio diazotrophicus]
MRLIALLVALLVGGLLIYKRMGPAPVGQEPSVQTGSDVQPPGIPTDPGEIKQFQQDMNEYMKEVEEKRAAAIEKATSQ